MAAVAAGSSTRARLEARRFLEDMRRVERRGRAEAKRLSVRVRVEALRAFRARGMVNVADHVVARLLPTVIDAMVVSHLEGVKRERAVLRAGMGLRLSVFDRAIAALSRSLDLSAAGLRKRYGAAGFHVVNDVASEMEKKLRRTVFELVQQGAHVGEAVDVLSERFDELGLAPRADYRLEAMFRTQTQVAYGAGRWQVDQDPDVQEILWGYTYTAVGDDRTRATHRALDGVTLPKEHPFWQRFWPPNGWNCRCAAIPVFDAEDEREAPGDVEPDDGFAYNAGVVFG